MDQATKPLLEAQALEAYYGPIRALHGVDLQVPLGAIVALLGPNGAGKTTILRAISGLVKTRGRIVFDGKEITGKPVQSIARLGVAHVTEGRGTLTELTVHENLLVGAYIETDKSRVRSALERVYSYFPALARLSKRPSGTLSGGEQQMLAIGRALMRRPRILLLDEPSLGLAPILTKQIFDILKAINAAEGVSLLLVEQHVNLALEISEWGYVVAGGKIVMSGDAAALRGHPDVRRAYLGY